MAPWYIFRKARHLDGFVTRTCGEEIGRGGGSSELQCDYRNWYVIP